MSSHEHILQLDPNERVLYTVKRSLFGLLPHFIFATVSFLVFLAGIFYIARFQDQLNLPVGQVVAIAGGAVLVAEIATYLMIRTYLRNILILTNESIVEHQQITPFASKSAQLSLANIEDVSMSQNGFFATTFNYGTVTVQTAGEQPNFVLTFANSPREATAAIIGAHEAFTEHVTNQ